MAPFLEQLGTASPLLKRDPCGSHQHLNYQGYCVNDSFYGYGRWILAAVIIGLFFATFFLWACINTRRRRRQGVRPMYGTGWMAAPPQYNNNNPNAYNPPPPAYGAQSYPMDNRYQPAEGAYGQQSTGVEPPKNVYGGGNEYAPPAGPPPGK
ncbi:chitin synthesis regulation, resistance to congo red-domain-containing protein [Astrocystis sublimbata]|nr:chitin synthesis regulation, resistance to congo red-domain-containing protein [Astrocystis sublimbata]